MEYFTEQITNLKGYIGDSFDIFTNEKGAIFVLIASVVVIAIVLIPKLRK